jgi:hypothetical protein
VLRSWGELLRLELRFLEILCERCSGGGRDWLGGRVLVSESFLCSGNDGGGLVVVSLWWHYRDTLVHLYFLYD